MNKKKTKRGQDRRKTSIVLIVILLLLISVGYATLITQLDISGDTKISKNSWNVYISEVNNIKVTGEAEVTEDPVVDSTTTTTSLHYNVTLNKPGDAYQFNFTVKNEGTIDIKLKELPELTGLTDSQKEYIDHLVLETDGSALDLDNAFITAGESKSFMILVSFTDRVTTANLPTEDQTTTLNAKLSFVQKK